MCINAPVRILYFVLIAVVALVSCQGQGKEAIPTARATLAIPTRAEPGPTETATPPETETAESELDEDCRQGAGRMEFFDLQSEYLDAGLQFRAWLPPCYDEQTEGRFPVLYLIHGQTFNDDQWYRLGADEAAAQGISAGHYAPFIIVMPFDLASAQPSADPFGEAFIKELLPFVDANLRTLSEREYRAVGGLSRGASWALHLALRYPELFGAVGGHSPPVFVEDAPQMEEILDAIPIGLMPRIWLDIGENDQQAILNSAIWFEALLTERGIPHQWQLFQGFHDEEYWASHVEQYLDWYTQGW